MNHTLKQLSITLVYCNVAAKPFPLLVEICSMPFVLPVDKSFYRFSNLTSNDIDTGNFQFSCVNQPNVLLCFNLIRSNAVGCDNMHPKFIRILLPVLLSYIHTYIIGHYNPSIRITA